LNSPIRPIQQMRAMPAVHKPAYLSIKRLPKVWLWPAICTLIILSTASFPQREVRSPGALYETGGFDLNVKIEILFWMCALFVAITWAVRHISTLEFASTLQNLPIIRWVAAFFCISALSTFWSPSFALTSFRAMQLLTLLLLVIWLVRTRQTPQSILAGLYWILAVFGILSIVGFIFWPEACQTTMFGARTETIRLGRPFYSSGMVGETVAVILSGLFCRAMSSRGSTRTVLLLASAAAFGIIIGTRSRAALIMLLLVVCTLLIARKAGVLIVLAGILLGLLLSLGIGFSLLGFVNRSEGLQKTLTLNNRTTIWVKTLETALEKPWFGQGYVVGNRDMLHERLVEEAGLGGGTQAHNAVLAAFIDTGIIGAVLIIAFYFEMSLFVFRYVSAMRRTRKHFWARAEICSIGVAIVAQSLPSCGVAQKVGPSVFVALLAALAIARATDTLALDTNISNHLIRHTR